MDGITGYVSIMAEPWDYCSYTKLGKLKHDLLCLEFAGYSGYSLGKDSIESRGGIVATRKWFIDDVKRQIKVEERKIKLKKLDETRR